MNRPNFFNVLLKFTFYYNYLKYKKSIYNLGKKTVLYLIWNRINGLSECKTEKRNSQHEHGQPMEQTRGLFCTCDSGVARCQSQRRCHFWACFKNVNIEILHIACLAIYFQRADNKCTDGLADLQLCYKSVFFSTGPIQVNSVLTQPA